MVNRDDTVIIRVNSARKEKWEQAAEDSPEHTSLSEFLRDAVYNEINDTRTSQADALTQSVDLTPLESQLNTIETEIKSLERDISQLKSDEEATPRDIALDIRDHLPSYDSVAEVKNIQNVETSMPNRSLMEMYGRLDAIKDYYMDEHDYSEQTIDDAITILLKELPNVQKINVTYARENPNDPANHLVVIR